MKTPAWLLLLYGLPSRRNAERVNLWRKLRKFGAVALKTSGYVLPDAPAHLERFEWLSRQIHDAGGQADVLKVMHFQGLDQLEVRGLFNQARAQDYHQVVASCRVLLSRPKRSKVIDRNAELAKLKNRFEEIRQIDYFDCPSAHDAQMLLQRLERSFEAKTGSRSLPVLNRNQFSRKTWLTRPRPGIDRAGSAWLIRKFIDPAAKFIFDMQPSRHRGALPFDMAGVEFSHQGDDCTFETLTKRFGIEDPAVLAMAEMVHDADLEDEKFHRSECLGLNAVLGGWARSGMKDSELLARGMECFEGLYCQLRR